MKTIPYYSIIATSLLEICFLILWQSSTAQCTLVEGHPAKHLAYVDVRGVSTWEESGRQSYESPPPPYTFDTSDTVTRSQSTFRTYRSGFDAFAC